MNTPTPFDEKNLCFLGHFGRPNEWLNEHIAHEETPLSYTNEV